MSRVRTITIDQLKPGMFIVGIDQPWYRTPFFTHKRLIRHTGDVDLLRQCGVRELKIDPSQGLDLAPLPPGPSPAPADIQETASNQADPSEKTSTAKTPRPQSTASPLDPLHLPDPDKSRVASAATRHQTTAGTPSQTSDKETSLLESKGYDQAAEPRTDHSGQPVAFEEAALPDPDATGNPPSQATEEELSSLRGSLQAAAAEKTYSESLSSMDRLFEELEAGVVPRPDTLRVVVSNVLSRILDDSNSMISLLFQQKMKRFDRTLASHALDICTLSLIVGRTYGVADGELELLGAGALLHDIGYVRLPRNLYRKTRNLSEQETALMQQHSALGLVILREALETREAIARIVAEHHERSNGSGFPNKLQGDAVSVLAQLVGLVDTYDGMVSRRGGRPAMLPHDAIRELFRLGDSGQYTKEMIQAMIGSLGVYPIGSLVQLNTEEQAVVVGMNPSQRLKPVIKVITGAQGGSYLTPIRVDLGAQAAGAPTRTIAKVLDPLQERVNVAMFLDGLTEEAA